VSVRHQNWPFFKKFKNHSTFTRIKIMIFYNSVNLYDNQTVHKANKIFIFKV
jgi:hypothetical protein